MSSFTETYLYDPEIFTNGKQLDAITVQEHFRHVTDSSAGQKFRTFKWDFFLASLEEIGTLWK